MWDCMNNNRGWKARKLYLLSSKSSATVESDYFIS